jgi:hypothetical protein
MKTAFLVALVGLASFSHPQSQVKTALFAYVSSSHRFAETTPEQSRIELRETVLHRLRQELEKLEISLASAEALEAMAESSGWRPARSQDISEKELKKAATSLNANRIVVIEIANWDQRNRPASAALNNPNKPGSQTKVEVRLWVWDDAQSRLLVPGTTLSGEAGANYFGTTLRSELSGTPDAVSRSIRTVNSQRMRAIALATWNAIRTSLTIQ